MTTTAKIALGFCSAFVAALLLFLYVLARPFQIRFPDVSGTVVLADAAAKAIHVAEVAAYGDARWRKLDLTSVGAPAKESRLIQLRLLLEDYKHDFDRYPASASELSRLESRESLRSDQRDVLESDARECRVFPFPRDGYLLNCDGWRPEGANSIALLAASFDATTSDPTTERFCAAQGHVFLYAPPRAAHPWH